MEKIRNLLYQIAIISKKNREILDATGGRFNMFSICGVNHYENTHSAIIAELLNPNGTHGLKSKLLECFIETLGETFTIPDFNYGKSRVYTEYSTEEGRIDILIEDNRNKAVIIENKIYADDQWEQLKRYDRYAGRKYGQGNYQILYLTLEGNDASAQSSEGVIYSPVSYQETVIGWLEKCIAIAARSPIVRETIIQYINHLKQLTNQDMDTKNKEEITEILSKTDNLRAAKTIYQNYSEVFDYLAAKHFNTPMQEFANQKGLQYQYGKSHESYIEFKLTNPEWQKKCSIAFTFDKTGYYYGIFNDAKTYKVSDENRNIIRRHMRSKGIVSPLKSEYWAFYTYFPPLTLDVWEEDIIGSRTFLDQCKEKIEQLLEAMEHIEL